MSTFSDGSVYEKLGVRPFINLAGSLTYFGGFVPSHAVERAMNEANRQYSHMSDLTDRAGEFVADALGVEAAYITPGGISALVLSAAGLMAGDDLELMRRLPDTTGTKNEFVVQAPNKAAERSYELAGGKVVYAGDNDGCTPEQLEAVIGPNTVAVAQYYHDPSNYAGGRGSGVLALEKTAEIAHSKGLPLVVDAAVNSRPLDLFRSLARSGDLVSFGGKYFGAPSATGFVCGKKELIDHVKAHGPVHGNETFMSFGRGYKLDRMQIVALVVALDEWLSMDHEQRLRNAERQLSIIEDRLEGVPGVKTEQVRGEGYDDLVLIIAIGPEAAKTAEQARVELEAGYPSIVAISAPPTRWKAVPGEGTILVRPYTMADGEEIIVAEKLRRVLTA